MRTRRSARARVTGLVLSGVAVALALGTGVPAQAATSALTPVQVIGGPGHAELYGWGADTVPPGFEGAGDVLVSDYLNFRVVRVDRTTGAITTVVRRRDGLHTPYDVAVNPVNGNIAVGDVDNGARVAVYSASGTFLRSCRPGMRYPGWLDYDSTGRLAVADSRGQEIGVLDDATCAVRFRFGSTTLRTPRGIDFAPDGTLWVNDVGNRRIAHFRVDGSSATLLRTFSAPGTDNRGLLYDPDSDRIYLVNAASTTVDVYTPTGSLAIRFGSRGTGPGQFVDGGRGITRDGDGNVWVGDMPNFRVQKFSPAGVPLLAVPEPAAPPPLGGFNQPGGVGVAADGSVVVSDTFNWRVQEFSPDGEPVRQFGTRLQLNYARGLAVDRRPGRGEVVVGNTDLQQVVKYRRDGTRLWTTTGLQSFSVAVDQSGGTVYAALFTTNAVAALDTTTGRVLRRFGTGLSNPRGVAVDPLDGTVWVSSQGNGRVSHFSASGALLGSFASGAGQAADLEVDEDTVFLADRGADVIRTYDRTGTPTGTFGGPGTAPGRFQGLQGMDLHGRDLYVTETRAERVQHLRVTKS